MGKLFGTNGVRGIFGKNFTLEFVHDLTLSIGTFFGKGYILIGYDGRATSPIIAKTVCATLNSIGIDCNNAGLIPTPALEFATKKLGYKGAIMITASHNPPQYNGIKPVACDGVEVSREDESKIEDIFYGKKWLGTNSQWGKTGIEENTLNVYLDGIKSHIDIQKIQLKKLKVVLDVGNGTQAVAAPQLCKDLGCQVITINDEIDGNFPGRGSEPTPQNLKGLTKKILESKADIGVAFDGDGDRSLFCDELGKILTGDISALLFSKYLLEKNPNSKVITCLNSGSAIDILVEKTNSKVIRTKVGSVEVSRKMIPTNALIGFEENGGYMFGKHNQVRDGAMTLAIALDILASSNKTLSELVTSLPRSFTTKDKVSCSAEDAQKLILTLKEEFPTADTSDGIKITFDSKNWVMIRPSGTESIVRIYAEAESYEKLDNLMENYIKKTKSILSR